MNLAITVLEGILILLFIVAGFFKLVQTRQKISAVGGGRWADEILLVNVKIIGIFEITLAVGLLLTLIAHISMMIGVFSGIGMGIVMIGATALHTRKKEYIMMAFTIILSSIAFFVACQSYFSSM